MRWNELIGTGGDVLAVMEDDDLRRSPFGGLAGALVALPDGPGGLRRWLVEASMDADDEFDAEWDED